MTRFQFMLVCLSTGVFIVVVRLLAIVFWLWNQPLSHGPGYFLGVAVPPGFYDGPGIRWLRRYRGLLVAQYLLLFSVFAAVVVSGRWSRMPVIAPVDVVSFFLLVGGLHLWARRALGGNPPVVARIAVPLEPRRAGKYIWWPAEAALLVLLAASWLLLLRGGAAPVNWGEPVLDTYVILGVFIVKIMVARGSFPLPPDRTEEHHRYMEAYRSQWLLVMDLMRWMIAVILAGYAVLHGWPPAANMPWIRWSAVAAAMAIATAMCVVMIRGARRLAEMGRDLRPPGSWRSAFRPSPQMFLRGGLAWGVPYVLGLVLLLVWFAR
jgi:hypothetical protein